MYIYIYSKQVYMHTCIHTYRRTVCMLPCFQVRMSVGGERFTVDILHTIVYIYDYIYSAYTFICTHIPNP